MAIFGWIIKRGGVNRFRGRVAGAGRAKRNGAPGAGGAAPGGCPPDSPGGLTVLGARPRPRPQTVTTFVSNPHADELRFKYDRIHKHYLCATVHDRDPAARLRPYGGRDRCHCKFFRHS